MSKPPREAAVWAGLLAAGAAYEWHEVRDHDTGYPLSAFIRWTFHTSSPVGAAVFTLGLSSGSAWLWRHILAAVDSSTTAAVVSDTRQRQAVFAESQRNEFAPYAFWCVPLRRKTAGQRGCTPADLHGPNP